MADSTKVLGQIRAATTTLETLYTVPDVTQTTCSTLVVCNATNATRTFRVAIRVSGATLSDKQYLYYDKSITGNNTTFATIGMTLDEGDVVSTYASGSGITFNLFGVETDNDD